MISNNLQNICYSDNININKSINSINSDMHAIKINDENTVIFENLPTINNMS